MSETAIKALKEIKALKTEMIGDTGFSVGPLALFQAAQRIAREALKAERKAALLTPDSQP